MNRSLVFLILCPIVLLFSCGGGDSLFEGELSIDDNTWQKDYTASFNFEIKDTLKYYDIFLNIRNTEEYAYSNIYLFTTMHFPNGKIAVDTIQCILAEPNGKWKGSGLGGMYDNRIRLQRKKAFPLNGKYKMEINQAMRGEEIKGITDIGFGIALTKD